MAKNICFYFQVHQPYRIKEYSFFHPEDDHDYFVGPANATNQAVFEKVSKKCYLPTTDLMLHLLERHPEVRFAFSLSGVFLDQCEEYGAIGHQVLDNFRRLAKTGRVEFLAETYYHSLSFLHSKLEFTEQVLKHHQRINYLFGQKPRIFRNTELIYSNELAEFIRNLGFWGVLAEGWPKNLKGHSPNYLRRAIPTELNDQDQGLIDSFAPLGKNGKPLRAHHAMSVLTKNFKLSDDIAFRFGNKGWSEHPLTADRFAAWVDSADGDVVNLFMDYETFGEHQWEDTGIFTFLEHLPKYCIERGIAFKTPTEAVTELPQVGEFDAPQYVSWADEARDLSAWLDNDLQRSVFEEIHRTEQEIHPLKAHQHQPSVGDLIHDFRRLQTSDHLYYMCTKYWSDGDVHAYFSPYGSPYDAYINYMNVLRAFRRRVAEVKKQTLTTA